MPAGLKIENRTGHVFYGSAWILAGVDHNEDEFDNDLDQEDFEEVKEDKDNQRNDDELSEGQLEFEDADDDEVTEVDKVDSDDDSQRPPDNNAGVVPKIEPGKAESQSHYEEQERSKIPIQAPKKMAMILQM